MTEVFVRLWILTQNQVNAHNSWHVVVTTRIIIEHRVLKHLHFVARFIWYFMSRNEDNYKNYSHTD